jgi:nickel-dependent lactate racemase
VRVHLAYGDGRLQLELQEAGVRVVEPRFRAGVADPQAFLAETLRRPIGCARLRETVRRGQTVAVAICDGTRPQPRELMLRALLEELAPVSRPEDLVVIVATGTHRPNTGAELQAMLGEDLAGRLAVVNHDGGDPTELLWCGRLGADVPVWLNRTWLAADVRITTGFAEPHMFAGFSGGPKLVAPGMAALDTVLTLHDSARIAHPRATWAITSGNPIHDDVRAIAAATGVDFAFDVVLNRDQQVVGAFAGELFAMHAAACSLARELSVQPVDAPFDVVLTSNSGYPLDQNLYQCVKGISAAAQVVRPGGTILCAGECRDGFPDHGRFKELMTGSPSPEALLSSIEGQAKTVHDQWEAQILARVQRNATVLMHTDHLAPDALRAAHLVPCPDLEAAVDAARRRVGSSATVCVLPEGPQTVPVLAS